MDRQVSSAMVGRDRELNRLELQVMKVVNGEGSVVNIIGEAGIGKSRLMAELRRREVMKKVTLLEGRAISIGRNLSFHPIIDLLKQWAGISEEDPEATGLRQAGPDHPGDPPGGGRGDPALRGHPHGDEARRESMPNGSRGSRGRPWRS